jgi:transposase-like protein
MRKFSYAGYRFPSEIIRQAIWLYLRFTLSLRDVEDLCERRSNNPSLKRPDFPVAPE